MYGTIFHDLGIHSQTIMLKQSLCTACPLLSKN